MTYYDLHVYTDTSIGENTLEDMIAFAKRLGLAGLGIVRFPEQELIKFPQSDIDLVSVVLIKAENVEHLQSLIRGARNSAEIVAVHGGIYDINRAACENPMVDMLCHPELGRVDSGMDHIVARAAQENEVAIEINFHKILEAYKKNRVRILTSLRKNIMLCKKYEAPIITTSGSLTKWDLRFGRELAALPAVLGLELGKAVDTASTIPKGMVDKNREKLAGTRWEGVSIAREETE